METEWIDLPYSNGVERVSVKILGDAEFEILHSPCFIQGLARKDVIRIDKENPSGFKLLNRGEQFCVQSFSHEDSGISTHFLNDRILHLGGKLDSVVNKGTLNAFSMSISSGTPLCKIEDLFLKIGTEIPDFEWSISNILNADQSPLNWWNPPRKIIKIKTGKFDSAGQELEESVFVDVLSQQRVRLAFTPIVSKDLAAGDEIAPLNETTGEYRFIQSGGNAFLKLHCGSGFLRLAKERIAPQILRIGGRTDAEFVSQKTAIIVYTVPSSTRLLTIEDIISRFGKDFTECTWRTSLST